MGFRSSEALTLEWSNVDLKRKLITLSDTKNRTDHTLPIPDFLTDYLTNLYKQNADNNWVFPSINGPNPMSIPIKPIKKVIEASGVDFSPHDCRRTFATIAEAIGLPMSMIKRLMNHVTTNDVTGGYIVTEEETLRTVINKIADYIQAKVTTK